MQTKISSEGSKAAIAKKNLTKINSQLSEAMKGFLEKVQPFLDELGAEERSRDLALEDLKYDESKIFELKDRLEQLQALAKPNVPANAPAQQQPSPAIPQSTSKLGNKPPAPNSASAAAKKPAKK